MFRCLKSDSKRFSFLLYSKVSFSIGGVDRQSARCARVGDQSNDIFQLFLRVICNGDWLRYFFSSLVYGLFMDRDGVEFYNHEKRELRQYSAI